MHAHTDWWENILFLLLTFQASHNVSAFIAITPLILRFGIKLSDVLRKGGVIYIGNYVFRYHNNWHSDI